MFEFVRVNEEFRSENNFHGHEVRYLVAIRPESVTNMWICLCFCFFYLYLTLRSIFGTVIYGCDTSGKKRRCFKMSMLEAAGRFFFFHFFVMDNESSIFFAQSHYTTPKLD